MAYIVTRKNRFYVVAYDGTDPRTGKERRRWHPAGSDRSDAEAIAKRLAFDRIADRPADQHRLTVARYLQERWMPRRRTHLHASTAYRYSWMIDNYITPALGKLQLNALTTEHLDRLYTELLETGGARDLGLAPKTVYDVHVIMRSALKHAHANRLIDSNVALTAHAPKPRKRERTGPECWTASQLSEFLTATSHLRLWPALHLAATTGIRRGESQDCAGATGTNPTIGSRSLAAAKSSEASPPRHPSRQEAHDEASTSPPTANPY